MFFGNELTNQRGYDYCHRQSGGTWHLDFRYPSERCCFSKIAQILEAGTKQADHRLPDNFTRLIRRITNLQDTERLASQFFKPKSFVTL